MKKAVLEVVRDATNDAATDIEQLAPYAVSVTLEGTAPFLFHRWSNEAVAEKAKSKKGSAAKKSDNLESYVYRTPKGTLAIPGEYLRMAVVGAARYRQDPRSPRKSAMDLFKASIVALEEFADLGVKEWDYVDKRRVIIQRSAITRCRPAMAKGWTATFVLHVLAPEYVSQEDLNETIAQAGRLIGIGDFRPTFGRFQITNFKVLPS